MLTIGLDVGTQSTKCLVLNVEDGTVISRGSSSYPVISDRHGQAEQHPAVWISVSVIASLDQFAAFNIEMHKK